MKETKVSIYYDGDLAKVRMPDGASYASKADATTPEARVRTVKKGQRVKASKEAAERLCGSGLWKRDDGTKVALTQIGVGKPKPKAKEDKPKPSTEDKKAPGKGGKK